MASVNKVILLGHLGRDPEIRYLPSGMAIANVSLATTSKRKDKTSGESIEETQWHRVQFFDRLAEIAGEYLRKGMPVYVEGRLKYGKYTDQAGIEKYTTDIVADQLQMLGQRQDAGGDAGQNANPRPAPARPAARAPSAQPQRQAPAPAGSGFDDMEDDIPF